MAPLIAQLRTRGNDIADVELARFNGKLSDLDAPQREAVEAMARGIVNKLLHEPTIRLKDAAGHARGDRLADSLRDLFDLDRAGARGDAVASSHAGVRWRCGRRSTWRRSSSEIDEVVVSTVGDRNTDVPIHSMGGKGVFVKEVQAAVLDGRADFAVHSGKDLPAVTPDGLVLVCVPARADARDASSAHRGRRCLPAHIATGSVRRRAQLAWHRPDLVFSELRGNIQTRLEKLESGGFDGVVMAAAAIDRLALDLSIPVDRLDPAIMLPQVAQGALAIECRADDTETISVLRAIQHADTRRVVDTERAFLHELGGDCDLPAGAHATLGTTASRSPACWRRWMAGS